MGSFTGTQFDDIIDIRNEPLQGPETGHKVNALAGYDTVYGSPYRDNIWGGGHDDELYGFGNDDFLNGEGGSDTLVGGAGDDFLVGGIESIRSDTLAGGKGDDRLSGNEGDDFYVYFLGDGIDTINDELSPTGASGYGGGNDTIYFPDFNLADIAYKRAGNSDDLWLSTLADLDDGRLDAGVVIEDFYTGNEGTTVEVLLTGDNYSIDLTSLLV
ncbi:calcium-binding protein [Halomonas sp. GXIMD04776]|uniref:calcium-binding protein n=1 Tax=Halomonas sp. GXIMD04776 TaxID=3415605 RepID=UPI003CA08A1B